MKILGEHIYANFGILLIVISVIFYIVNLFTVVLSPLIPYILFAVLGLIFPIGAIILGYVGIQKGDSRKVNTNIGRTKLTTSIIIMGICLFILEMVLVLFIRCNFTSC